MKHVVSKIKRFLANTNAFRCRNFNCEIYSHGFRNDPSKDNLTLINKALVTDNIDHCCMKICENITCPNEPELDECKHPYDDVKNLMNVK